MKTKKGKVRYAVVGAGHIAQTAILPAFRHTKGNSELVAVLSSSEEKRSKLARKYRVKHTGPYEELERVLEESKAEAIFLATPNTEHREFTERAARVGVHVLCEKPMAMTEEDCMAMIGATEENHVRLMIAYRLHFEAANLKAIKLAHSGRLGQLKYMSSSFSQQVRPGDIRTRADKGGGALFNLGVYCVNAARYLFREEPEEVVGYELVGSDEQSQDVDEMTSALLRFSNGKVAEFVCSQGAADVSSYRLIGAKGDLSVEPAYDYQVALEHYFTLKGKTRHQKFPKRDQFAAEIAYFSRCIREDTEPEPSGWEGLADVRVMVAIQQAARSGRVVKLPPFDRKRRPDMSQEIEKPPVQPPPEKVQAPSPSIH